MPGYSRPYTIACGLPLATEIDEARKQLVILSGVRCETWTYARSNDQLVLGGFHWIQEESFHR